MGRKIRNLNEVQAANDILENGFTNGETNQSDLTLLAKLFVSKNPKITENKLKKELLSFIERHDRYFNKVLGLEMLYGAIKSAFKYSLLTSECSIKIYKEDLDPIRSLDEKSFRLAFASLVLARYEKQTSFLRNQVERENYDALYIHKSILEIFRIAGFKKADITQKRANGLVYDLFQQNCIRSILILPKTRNGTTRIAYSVMFTSDKDNDKKEVEIVVEDIKLIPEYIDAILANIPKDKNVCSCGNKFEKNPKSKRDICEDCYEAVRRENKRISVQKTRSKKTM